jgi:hypothetical protein
MGDLVWFEGVCAELQRQPKMATEKIQSFRNTEGAHGLSMTFLHGSNNPETQFQILNVLQFTSLKFWDRFDAADRNSVRTCLWAKILGNHATMPQYVLGKAYQVFALTWKCGWGSEDESAKQALFTTINTNLMAVSSLGAYRAAAQLLQATLEEFGSRSSAQIGASLEFHRVAHVAFEVFGLQQTFELALQLLGKAIAAMPTGAGASNGAVSSEQANALGEAARLMSTLLQWDFGCPDMLRVDHRNTGGSGRGDAKDGSGLLAPPVPWAPHLLQANLVHAVSAAHTHLVAASMVAATANTKAAAAAAGALWELLVDLASLSGAALKADTAASAGFLSALSEAAAAALARCGDTHATFFQPLMAWAGPNTCDESRAKAVDGSILLTQRLLGNWRLRGLTSTSCFESLLSCLVQLLLTMAAELRALSRRQWVRLSQSVGVPLSPEDDSGLALFGCSEMLLDGWRGESAVALLDTLSLLQDDPSLSRMPDCATLLTEGQRGTLLHCGRQGFDLLFEAVLFFSLYDAVDAMGDDEDEDVEEIVSRDLYDFVGSITALGRLEVTGSVGTVLRYTRECITLASGLTAQQGQSSVPLNMGSCVFVLETARVCSLFLTNILVDDFDKGRGGSSSSSCSSEAPQIPALVLGAVPGLLVSGQPAGISPTALVVTPGGECVWAVMGDLLQLQTSALSQAADLSSPLVSSLAMNFFASYIRTYVDPDAGLYDANCPGVQAGLLCVHGTDFAAPLEAIFNVCLTFLHRLPLEEDVVAAVAAFIDASSRLKLRVDTILGMAPVQSIFQLLISAPSTPNSNGPGCRLSAKGLRLVWGSMAALATRCSDPAPFNQLLAAVHARVGGIAALQPSASSATAVQMSMARRQLMDSGQVTTELELCLAVCGGVALSPMGRSEALAQLMDSALPALSWFIADGTPHVDGLLQPSLSLIRDYAEGHMTALSPHSSSVLYSATAVIVKALAVRLVAAANTTSNGNKADAQEGARWEEAFLADVLLLALEVLYLLANQDMFDDASDVSNTSMNGTSICVVGMPIDQVRFHKAADILVFGLDVVAPVLSPTLLKTFPAVAEKYFSYLQYILSALDERFAHWLCSSPRVGATFLRNLSEQLIWGAGAVDAASARMSLQCLQLVAAFHIRAQSRQLPGLAVLLVPECGQSTIFIDLLRRLLTMIIYPDSCDYGIAWDRVDACANAFITLVALDQTAFNAMAHELINQQQPQHRAPLLACFERMTTANGVQMGSIERPNRSKFVTNMRVFVNEIRPLVLYR